MFIRLVNMHINIFVKRYDLKILFHEKDFQWLSVFVWSKMFSFSREFFFSKACELQFVSWVNNESFQFFKTQLQKITKAKPRAVHVATILIQCH